MTPQEAIEFRKACNAIRKYIPDVKTRADFDGVVQKIVTKALENL